MNIYKAGKFAKDWKKITESSLKLLKIKKIEKIGKIWEEVGRRRRKKSTSRAFASRTN